MLIVKSWSVWHRRKTLVPNAIPPKNFELDDWLITTALAAKHRQHQVCVETKSHGTKSNWDVRDFTVPIKVIEEFVSKILLNDGNATTCEEMKNAAEESNFVLFNAYCRRGANQSKFATEHYYRRQGTNENRWYDNSHEL